MRSRVPPFAVILLGFVLTGLSACGSGSGSGSSCYDSGLFDGICGQETTPGFGGPPEPRDTPQLLAFDLVTGQVDVVSSPSVGAGLHPDRWGFVLLNAARNRALVLGSPELDPDGDRADLRLIAVDLTSGVRGLISDADPNSAIPSVVAGAVDEAANLAYVQAHDGVITEIDLATGARRRLQQSTTARGLALDTANNRAFFGPKDGIPIWEFDLTTGDPMSVASAPFPRGFTILGYDSARERLVLSINTGNDGLVLEFTFVEVDVATGDLHELSPPLSFDRTSSAERVLTPFRPETYDSTLDRVIGLRRRASGHVETSTIHALVFDLASGAMTQFSGVGETLTGNLSRPAHDDSTQRLYFVNP